MADVLMTTDTRQFDENIERHSLHLGALNAILACYEVMNLGTLTGAEFIALVNNPANVVFDKMTNGQPVQIMGMQVDKSKAMELLLKPAGYSEMIAAIEAYKKNINWLHYLQNTDFVNGEVVLHQNVIDAETEASKVYAKTDKEKQLFQFAQAVVDAANAAFGDGASYDLARLVENTIHNRNTPSGSITSQINHWSYEVVHKKILRFGHQWF